MKNVENFKDYDGKDECSNVTEDQPDCFVIIPHTSFTYPISDITLFISYYEGRLLYLLVDVFYKKIGFTILFVVRIVGV